MQFTHNYFFSSRSPKMLVKYTDFHVFSFIVHWIASATTRTCPSSFFEWILQSLDMQTIISEAIFTYTIYEQLIALEWAFGDDCDSIKKNPPKNHYIYSVSSSPCKGECGEFVLESFNRKGKRLLPSRLPDDQGWIRTCRNVKLMTNVKIEHRYNV